MSQKGGFRYDDEVKLKSKAIEKKEDSKNEKTVSKKKEGEGKGVTRSKKSKTSLKRSGGSRRRGRTQKKYQVRKSPPYSANDYCGKTKTGNDGRLYQSTKNKNYVCTWKIKKPNTKFFRGV